MDSPAWMFTKALNHRQKVCRLYKRACRELESWLSGPGPDKYLEMKFQRVVMRARFDANSDEKDPRKAQLLLADGCHQLWKRRHYKPFRFPLDPFGSSYDRNRESSDLQCDNPAFQFAEREQFPYYFNRREQRKKEVFEHWRKIEKAWDEEIAAIQTELPKEGQTVAKI